MRAPLLAAGSHDVRRVPQLPLPSTTFIAGRAPPPRRTPRPAEGWHDAAGDDDGVAFAWGCDLFDAGCFFEAHELWEGCWHQARARGDDDDVALLHGLIRLAAAGVKLGAGNTIAVASHVAGARAYFGCIKVWKRGLAAADVDAAASLLLLGKRPCLP
jgi:hypothetical protein